jgi:DNA replication protein
MSFNYLKGSQMSKLTADLVRIAAAGGGMTLPATKPTEDLVRICAAASNKRAQITIVGADSLSTADLVRIAAAGEGCVIFDLSA